MTDEFDEIIKRVTAQLGPDATEDEIADAVSSIMESASEEELMEVVVWFVPRQIAVYRFNDAAAALKETMGERELGAAMARAQALVDEGRLGPVQESSPSTLVGLLHVRGDLEATADIAARLVDFVDAAAQVLEATGLPTLNAVVEAGLIDLEDLE